MDLSWSFLCTFVNQSGSQTSFLQSLLAWFVLFKLLTMLCYSQSGFETKPVTYLHIRNEWTTHSISNHTKTKTHNLFKEAYAFPFRSSEAFLQNEKWSNLLCTNVSRTFAVVVHENMFANTHIDPSQVGQKIPLFTTCVEILVADKHLIAKLPLVLSELSVWCVWQLASTRKWDSSPG